MRAVLLLAVALGLAIAFAAPPAQSVGGLALHGVGFGTYENNAGTVTCADSPFAVEVAYVAPASAVLHSEFAGSCLGTVGATVICCRIEVNNTQSPPAKVTFYCAGTEAAGLHCEGLSGNTLVTADVGPYGGPASAVTYASTGAFRFSGVFTAV